jgi:hypothetical protein
LRAFARFPISTFLSRPTFGIVNIRWSFSFKVSFEVPL